MLSGHMRSIYFDCPQFHRNEPLTTAELLDELERLDEDDVPNLIYITPPNDNENESDKDSGDEDYEYVNDGESEKESEISEDVLELLVKYTVMFSATKNYRLELGNEELLLFIAILYLSVYVPVPAEWFGKHEKILEILLL
ncbi:hypothetical protein JTB14_013342 [Gonioctena quinquepunctata]|nr:hypothetical protein JTB14_013342 [Gonioctena quinquepunctata]